MKTTQTKPDLVYTTYIRSTPQKVWNAITNPEFTDQYWGGQINRSDWKPGSPWQHGPRDQEDDIWVSGLVVESVPPTRLVLTWADPDAPEDLSRVTFLLAAEDDLVRLDVIHGDFVPDSVMAGKVSQGWPRVLSSLKSFLETGQGLPLGCKSNAAHAAAS